MRSDIDLRFQHLWDESPVFDTPAVDSGQGIIIDVVVPFRSLTLSPKLPISTVFSNARIPLSRNLILTTFAPVLGITIISPKLNSVLSATAPIITRFFTISPATTNLILSSFTPTTPNTITPPTRSLILSSVGPIDDVSNARLPLTSNLLLTSLAPTVTVVFTSFLMNPPSVNLIASTIAPIVDTTTAGLVAPVITFLRPAAAT